MKEELDIWTKPLKMDIKKSSNNELARATAANCLGKIGNANSSLKNDCISILIDHLEHSTFDVATLNGLVIAYLIELEAVNSIGAIRKAFSKGNVDLTVAGDIEDVEILLGLRTERETPHPNYFNPEIEKLI